MTEQAQPASPEVSQEFYIRVNDFIQMANRIERRYDTHHAQLAFVHALARYSGHHFRSTAAIDDEANRVAFADYIGSVVQRLVKAHLDDMSPLAMESNPPETEAGTPGDPLAE
jgi:hypothetical protein